MIRALLWDVDGTLAETERDGHRVAFNQAFAELGVPWRWSEQRYGELLRVSGGRERLLYDMDSQPDAPASQAGREQLAVRIHRCKNVHYARIVEEGRLQLRPGVAALLDDCHRADVALGIVTTTGRGNVAALLRRQLGPDWTARFRILVCAEDAPRKKPDPQAYERALHALEMDAARVVTVEDAPAGVAAARAAGVAALLTPSFYFPQPPLEGVLASGPSLAQAAGWAPRAADGAERITLEQITHWHATAQAA